MEEPREYTTDEVRQKFLAHARGLVNYWARQEDQTVYERVEGVVFSLLAAIDGSAVALPSFTLAPSPHPDDKEHLKSQGENWYPLNADISGGLHELFLQRKEQSK